MWWKRTTRGQRIYLGIVLSLAFLLAFEAAHGPQAAFEAGGYYVLLSIVHGLVAMSRRPLRGTLSVGLVVLWLGVAACVGMCQRQHSLLDEGMQPVIAALEAYRSDHATYPPSLSDLANYLAAPVPTCGKYVEEPFYSVLNSGSDFLLTCVTFGFNKHSYSPKEGYWYNWD